MKFFTREHRGGLKESLETMKEISQEEFLRLLKYYDFYAFDERCNQLLWLLKDLEHAYILFPDWIGIEL